MIVEINKFAKKIPHRMIFKQKLVSSIHFLRVLCLINYLNSIRNYYKKLEINQKLRTFKFRTKYKMSSNYGL